MIINLSATPPTSSSTSVISSSSLIKLLNSRSPKTHLSKSSLSFSTSFLRTSNNNQFFHQKRKNPHRKSDSFQSYAIPGLEFGALESAKSVLEASGVLAAIIIVHESGHFLAATLQGIHVSKFAVGFGPVLAKFNAANVEYSIRAFPLGGFVGFPDNDPNSDIPVDDKNLLKNRPIFDRVVVISAGVIANIIFAYTIIFVQVLSVGLPVQEAFPGVLVPDVRPLSAAARDGLLAGDVIHTVNGFELPKTGSTSVSRLVEVIKNNPGKNVSLRVARGDQEVEIGITPDESVDGTGRIGVQLSPNVKISKVKPKNIAEAFNFSSHEFMGLSANVVDGLKQTFFNFSQTASKVSGPIAIIAVGAEVARSNSDGLFQFAAILNINLAVLNILPLPALDGGSLALLLIEAARGGKKIPQEVEQGIQGSGIMLVLLLGLVLIVRDTLNLDFIKELFL
ncbi:hypothetical protein C5167_009364 [Papaver somniferum]|uniref:PDZ domain-containing protein n=1 Tax=Papaver somniferum TaxID=3469 RepID=A0A4Y7JX65_PAPSO|nr:probable membrane metalloprotease ARASP2, chloroplastic [Papaver somniferum]RZC65674.1 hypothetical protein C5167_009364 [Papaver somniferum]